MSIHTCPRCPLRFTTTAELNDHLDHDHHLSVTTLSQLSYPAASQAAPLYRSLVADDDVHTVLLIANQTIGSVEVDDAIRALHDQHRDRFAVFVAVPATPSAHLSSGSGATTTLSREVLDAHADDAGIAQARWRLRSALRRLAELGIVAHGRVADPNPLTAAAQTIGEESIDQILLSTLQPTLSRWLRADVAAALERRFGLPVTTVVSTNT